MAANPDKSCRLSQILPPAFVRFHPISIYLSVTKALLFDYNNKKAEYGIFIGEDSCRGKGFGSEAAKLIIEFAFKTLKLHKVFLRVFKENEAGIHSYKNAGFNIEGTFKDDICLGENRYKDMIFMAIIH